MLPSDIDNKHAFSLLSRRRFLQGLGATSAGLVLGGMTGDLQAYAGSPIPTTDGILVVVTLNGGNDGLNSVVPINVGRYYDLRKSNNISISPGEALGIGQGYGLHPNLQYLQTLAKEGHAAFIQGVGVLAPDEPNLSHFDSMLTWMRGQKTGGPFSGWLGRWLDNVPENGPLHMVNIGQSVPLHVAGRVRSGSSVSPYGTELGGRSEVPFQRLYSAISSLADQPTGLGPWGDAIASVERDAISIGHDTSGLYKDLPDGDLARDMRLAANLIGADIGVRVVTVNAGGYDNHRGELAEHANRMADLDAGLRALYGSLSPAFANRTTVLVISEFGRTPESNDSAGTDHGTANTSMIIGANVAGGFYGELPSFTDFDQYDRFKSNVDFRQVYATVLEKVLGADSTQVLGGAYASLPLFSATSTPIGMPIPPAMPTVPGRLIPVSPERRLDTREGKGAPKLKFLKSAVNSVAVLGVGGVPAQDVTAVIMNVTVTDPTSAGFVTVWPTGEKMPNASSLNFAAKQTVPNLVMSKVGDGGMVSMEVSDGSAHVLADIVAYISKAGGSTFMPMSPVRLRDTRDGEPKVGPNKTINVKVAGTNGVPASGVSAVVMNVTVTGPTAPGFVTVWPAGEALPNVSSLNFIAGQTVPNLVVCKVGGDGSVDLLNFAGSTHVIVDLLGYYDTAGNGAQAVATSPQRLLDTRNGSAKLGANATKELKVTGVGGVPTSAKAVVLNMTVTGPTSPSFLTVYPTGTPLPKASNLNFAANQTVPNQVIASVGERGTITIYNQAGSTDLIADLVGWYV